MRSNRHACISMLHMASLRLSILKRGLCNVPCQGELANHIGADADLQCGPGLGVRLKGPKAPELLFQSQASGQTSLNGERGRRPLILYYLFVPLGHICDFEPHVLLSEEAENEGVALVESLGFWSIAHVVRTIR